MDDINSQRLLGKEYRDEEEEHDLAIIRRKKYLPIGYQQRMRDAYGNELDIIGPDTRLPTISTR